ncbi:histidine kinase [Hyphomicrobium denitrificans]|nr:histidine kinase [Hyphomicrobium denitrificans]
MTTTSRMITEIARSIVQPRLGDCCNHFAYISRMRKVLRRYPLYFGTAAFLTSAAFAALLIFTSSFFLSNYNAAVRTAVGKLHLAQLSWVGQASEDKVSRSTDVVAEPSPDLAIFNDQMILRNSGVSLDSLKDGNQLKSKSASRDALALLQQAEKNLERNLEAKRVQVALLQIISFCFLLFCLARLSINARRVLIDGVDRIVGSVSVCESQSQSFPARDEIARLEQSISGVLTQIANSSTVAESRASLVRMGRIQDYLSNAIGLMLRHSFGDWMLRKFLYALERALDLENTAILFSEDASALHSGRCLFSNREPVPLTKEFYAELSAAGAGTIVEAQSDIPDARRAGIGFVDATGEMSVLLVEFPGDRSLEALETKTLRITASLLSMAAKLDGHDQEARRIAVLEERAAIARELHDSLAQSLSFMKIQLARLQSYQNNTSVESKKQMKTITSDLRHGLDNAYRELRELLATFRVHMDVRGLDFAIESAIEEFSQRSGLPISLDNRLVGAPLTVNEEFHVLHVVREALSNILHHARANNVWITMALRRNGAVAVTIDDDGVGYRPAEIKESSHHGQTIMKERAFSLGGTIDIAPRRNGGTRVKLTFTPKKLQYQ